MLLLAALLQVEEDGRDAIAPMCAADGVAVVAPPATSPCLIGLSELPPHATLVDTRGDAAHAALGVSDTAHVPAHRLAHGLRGMGAVVLFGSGKDDALLEQRCRTLQSAAAATSVQVLRGGLQALAGHRPTYGDAAAWRALPRLSALELDALLRQGNRVRVLAVGSDTFRAADVGADVLQTLERSPGRRRLQRILARDADATWVIAAPAAVADALYALAPRDALPLLYTHGAAHLAQQRTERDAVVAQRDWSPPPLCSLL